MFSISTEVWFGGYDPLLSLPPPLLQLAVGCREQPVGLTMATQFHLVEHGQELLSGLLGLQVGDHQGGRGRGWGKQQEGVSN